MDKITADKNKESIKGKKILVVGLGRSGQAATLELNALGADISVQDSADISKLDHDFLEKLGDMGATLYLGDEPKDIGDIEMLVLSPGVSTDIELVKKAKVARKEVIGELELAYRMSYGTFVAITGTNGKTTTTTLVGEIFKNAGMNTSVVGNIGVAVISKAVEAAEDEWMITECSSFQLDTTEEFKPKISAVLNLTPDHLNRHKTMEAYGAAKAKIFVNQDASDYLIVNADDEACVAMARKAKAKVIPFSRTMVLQIGAFLEGDTLVIVDENRKKSAICDRSDLLIIGDHNVENALAAAAISYFAGIDVSVIADTLKSFAGVEHRIEFCGEVDGVRYYNDSKATNTDAALIALKALKENIILIAGGDAKAQDFTLFGEQLVGCVKALVLLGRDRESIAQAARNAGFNRIYYADDMKACVEKAREIAESGDNVLLSPACASWDMYSDFEARGRDFKKCVSEL